MLNFYSQRKEMILIYLFLMSVWSSEASPSSSSIRKGNDPHVLRHRRSQIGVEEDFENKLHAYDSGKVQRKNMFPQYRNMLESDDVMINGNFTNGPTKLNFTALKVVYFQGILGYHEPCKSPVFLDSDIRLIKQIVVNDSLKEIYNILNNRSCNISQMLNCEKIPDSDLSPAQKSHPLNLSQLAYGIDHSPRRCQCKDEEFGFYDHKMKTCVQKIRGGCLKRNVFRIEESSLFDDKFRRYFPVDNDAEDKDEDDQIMCVSNARCNVMTKAETEALTLKLGNFSIEPDVTIETCVCKDEYFPGQDGLCYKIQEYNSNVEGTIRGIYGFILLLIPFIIFFSFTLCGEYIYTDNKY